MAFRDSSWGSRLAQAFRRESRPDAEEEGRSQAPCVALVSEESDLYDDLQGLLETEIVHFRDSSEYASLLETMRRWGAGVVFVDWRLGNGSAPEMVRFLRSDSDLAKIEVVALIPDHSFDELEDVVDVGCDDFLKIPFNHECAVARLRLLIDRSAGGVGRRDRLTGLSNRAVLVNRLRHAISFSQSKRGVAFAVLFLDIDRFRNVNEGLGHSAGDRLLQLIAERLDRRKRPGDLVVRFEGDEFVVVVEGIDDTRAATAEAQSILESFREPFDVDGLEVFTTASIGVVMWEPSYSQPDDVLRDADIALNRAKRHGKDGFVVFEESMRIRAASMLTLENDLRRALVGKEFRPYYQPIVSISSGRLAGFEVLARWQHPKRGLLPPAEFIDVVEEMGVIIQMDRFLIEEACRQLKTWQSRYRRLGALTVSLNISTTQFMQHDLVSQIDLILRNTGLYGSSLKLEVTESALMVDALFATQMLEQLRKLSIGISIDDFGTGYSSLAYLRKFEVDTLKIDCSFVFKMLEDEESMEIVRSVATLAKNLGKDTVAEGVETMSQLKALRKLGVDYAQGYHIAPPLAAEEVEGFLQRVDGVENHLDKILYDRRHRNGSNMD